jgi:UDP-N-acetylmuramate dehydrogenase
VTLPFFVRENVPLAGLTTFRIGGPARWLAEPSNRNELGIALALAREFGVEARVMGGGSNLLVADSGFAGMAIRPIGGDFGILEPDPDSPLIWRVGAGVGLARLLDVLADHGVSGAEFLAGIPGLVGGAAAMNAGGAESGFGQFITQADFLAFDGGERCLSGADLIFAYRRGPFSGGVVAGFRLAFRKMDGTEAVRARAREFRERKRRTQPMDLPSAGCVFRNPPGKSAGALLDAAGCKGWREGGAEVSGKHANFIVNLGGATACEAALLAGRMRLAVMKSAGIRLEPEITLWGDDPAFMALREGAV